MRIYWILYYSSNFVCTTTSWYSLLKITYVSVLSNGRRWWYFSYTKKCYLSTVCKYDLYVKTFASACGIGTSVPVTGIAQPTSTEVKRRTRKFCTTFSTYDQRILSSFIIGDTYTLVVHLRAVFLFGPLGTFLTFR